MGRVAATFGGVLVLAVVAGGLTEGTLALGRRGSLSNDAALRPSPSPQAAVASPSPTPTPSPSPTPTATPTPTPTPAIATATTNSFVHLRAAKSTASAILADLNGGTVVQLLPDRDSQWQQVRYNGLTGYIFRSYLAY